MSNRTPFTITEKETNAKAPFHLFAFQAEKYNSIKPSEIEKHNRPVPKHLIPHNEGLKARADASAKFAEYVQSTDLHSHITNVASEEPAMPLHFGWNIPLSLIEQHAKYWEKQDHGTAWEKLHNRKDEAITVGELCFWNNVISQFLIFKNKK